jgi:hypothetical protein
MLKKLLTATTLAVITTIGACAPEDISVSFTDADITAIKESIRTEFEKRKGVKVIEVSMIREGLGLGKATGFAKLKIPLFGEQSKQPSRAQQLRT